MLPENEQDLVLRQDAVLSVVGSELKQNQLGNDGAGFHHAINTVPCRIIPVRYVRIAS